MTPLDVKTKTLLADTETPVSAYWKLCRGAKDSFLLESVETTGPLGRYSIVGWDPLAQIALVGEEVLVSENATASSMPKEAFFDQLRALVHGVEIQQQAELPCVGSLVGYIGYDCVRLIERLPPAKPTCIPAARLILPSRYAVFDHLQGTLTLVQLQMGDRGTDQGLGEMEDALRTPLELRPGGGKVHLEYPPREPFLESVRKSKRYIEEGEIFQVVISDAVRGHTTADPFEVYRRLRVRSPSPYMFFLHFGDLQLVGASPETLVRVMDGNVMIRPIAGTRGRSKDPKKDAFLESELLGSEKERAEHIMLVDLARNDAGRVARWGTVEVDPFMVVERYSHVMHIVSEVRGILRPDMDAVDAFVAAFPAGTVTGAPKVRAMEIIDELESSSRGPYAGAVGYFGPGNQLDTCIAIRMVHFLGERFWIQAGAGIVADSVPEMEYREVLQKAAQGISALRTASEGTL